MAGYDQLRFDERLDAVEAFLEHVNVVHIGRFVSDLPEHGGQSRSCANDSFMVFSLLKRALHTRESTSDSPLPRFPSQIYKYDQSYVRIL